MKRILVLITIIFLTTMPSFAENIDRQLYLYCDNSGVEKCKYDILMRQALIINDLKLNDAQKKEMDNIFNTYGCAQAIIMNDINIQEKELKKLQKSNTSFKVKHEQKQKIKKLKCSLSKLEKTINKETKKILTSKQRSKYNTLRKNLF